MQLWRIFLLRPWNVWYICIISAGYFCQQPWGILKISLKCFYVILILPWFFFLFSLAFFLVSFSCCFILPESFGTVRGIERAGALTPLIGEHAPQLKLERFTLLQISWWLQLGNSRGAVQVQALLWERWFCCIPSASAVFGWDVIHFSNKLSWNSPLWSWSPFWECCSSQLHGLDWGAILGGGCCNFRSQLSPVIAEIPASAPPAAAVLLLQGSTQYVQCNPSVEEMSALAFQLPGKCQSCPCLVSRKLTEG